MTKVIALTGGIGSGKTYVASIFDKLGSIPCFYSDLEAKKIMNEDNQVKKEVISILGHDGLGILLLAFSEPIILK